MDTGNKELIENKNFKAWNTKILSRANQDLTENSDTTGMNLKIQHWAKKP